MDNLNMENVLDSLLEATGGAQNINEAIDNKNLAAAVRVATEALTVSKSIPLKLAERKSVEQSNEYRKKGNLSYVNKNYKEAIEFYNKALAYAPNDSLEVKLAYSNLSAVAFAIQDSQTCKDIAQAVLKMDCPAFLRVKLEKRLEDLKSGLCVLFETLRNSLYSEDKPDMLKYAKFDVPRNADIPCASANVSVEGKKVVAARDINSGSMVALERAFVSVQDEFEEYTSCYYCHKMTFFLIPCEGCCKALFCSKACRKKCLKEYHRIECHIVAYMGSMYKRDSNKLAIRAAIKMSLKLSWEQLRDASLEMGVKMLEKSSVAEAFDCNKPASLLCYDDQVEVSREKMRTATFVCAAAVHCLSCVPDYLPEEAEARDEAMDSLSRIILHLNTTFLRMISVKASAVDVLDNTYRCGAQQVAAWFSFASKLTHACEPNLLAAGLNDHVALVAIQRIKKGEPLTISFIGHFYEVNMSPFNRVPRIHQKRVYKHIQYLCECRVCLQDWHDKSHAMATLTTQQKMAYNQCNRAMAVNNSMMIINGNFVEKMKTISIALNELTGYNNTTQHYEAFGNLMRTLNIYQCVKTQNKTYEGTSKHYFTVNNTVLPQNM